MTEFDRFKSISIINDLPEEHIRQLFENCERVVVEKGDIIMEEGEERYSMFFFIEGEVVISNTMTMKATGQGGGFSEVEKSLVKLSAGQVSILGEMSVIEDLPRSATVKAFTSCILYEISKEHFEEFMNKHPEIGANIIYKIAKILCHRVRRSNKDLVKLSTALSIAVSRPA
jgi:CRP/FNR family transcriptional regulator, cyclic AMP receptor protein